MKKGIVFLLITIFILLPQVPQNASSHTQQMIPDEAIRLRILANSDSDEDQQIKRLVRDEVNAYISELVQSIDDIEEARNTIRTHVPELEAIVEATLKEAAIDPIYTVKYRSDVSFPLKMYDDYIYPAGEYEAVLITIGDGEGANWWCVLFPPLCFLDFSNGTTVADVEDDDEVMEEDIEKSTEQKNDDEALEQTEEQEEVEVRFFLFDWLGLS